MLGRVSRLSTYAVAVPAMQARMRGVDVAIDARLSASAVFIEALRRFDELVYAPLGMRMPGWVIYDCAVIPGVVYGMARSAGDVAQDVRDALGFDVAYDGPVPVTMLIAIPTVEPDHWLTYEIADLNQAFPDDHRDDLRADTLRAGIDALGAARITATAQWRTGELAIHARIAPLELLAAWVPAHDQPATAVVRYAPKGPPRADARAGVVNIGDDAALIALQDEIEAGARVVLSRSALEATR